ncbi:MAG: hypothetical protein JJT94_05290 [Bernardetiaceae bacterium]|nr:hypothetical protein [Bernardetiaceae bacterium]
MIKKMKTLALLLSLLGCVLLMLIACNSEQMQDEGDKQVVARAGSRFLYIEDIEGLFYDDMSATDSIDLLRRYADSWVKRELLLEKALEDEAISEAELQKKIEEYKYQLLSYTYQKKYIEDRLDTTISDKEINTYYNENSDNFKLNQTIVRAYFMQVPPTAPKRSNIEQQFRSNKSEDLEEVKSYAYGFARKHMLNPEQWIPLKQIIDNTPITIAALPKKNQFFTAEDSTGTYMLRVLELKAANQVAPIEYVTEKIKAIIINKRKVELQKEIEERIYRNARENKKYEILVKTE